MAVLSALPDNCSVFAGEHARSRSMAFRTSRRERRRERIGWVDTFYGVSRAPSFIHDSMITAAGFCRIGQRQAMIRSPNRVSFRNEFPTQGWGGLRIPTDQDIVSSRFVSHRVFPASVSLSENYVCVSLNWFVCLLTTGITCTASLVAV